MLKQLTAPVAMSILFAIAAREVHAADAETVTLDLGNNQSMKFVLIHAGTFQMGSPADEKGRRPDEMQHEARIADDFYMAVAPVTRGQFARFVSARNYRTEAETGTSGGYGIVDGKLTQRRDFTWKNPGFPQTDDHPVVIVTVRDSSAFITWASQVTRRRLTLPSESQFEYAARAGTATRFYNGDDDADAGTIGWYKDNADNATHPVMEKLPNAWGLYDMSGNVFQWCSNTYGAYRPGGPVVGDMNQQRNVLRGGSFLRPLGDLRSAARYRNAPASRNADNGFRLVMAVTPPAPAVVAPVTPTPQPERPQIEPTMPPARQGSAPAAAPRPGDEFRVMPQGEVEVHQVSSRGFGLVCLAVPCVFVLALIGIIIAVVKRSRPTGPQQPFPFNPNQPNPNVPPVSGIQPRATQDGFWVDTTRYNAGDRLRYRYQGPGGMVEDEFVVDPSTQGQFIYTGVTPMNIVLLGLAVAGAAGFLQSQLPPQPPPIPPQPRRTDTGFRNYPSAY